MAILKTRDNLNTFHSSLYVEFGRRLQVPIQLGGCVRA